MYLYLPSNPNASDEVTSHQPIFLTKMYHYRSWNLRVARKFTGLPPRKAGFTYCPGIQKLPHYLFQSLFLVSECQMTSFELANEIPQHHATCILQYHYCSVSILGEAFSLRHDMGTFKYSFDILLFHNLFSVLHIKIFIRITYWWHVQIYHYFQTTFSNAFYRMQFFLQFKLCGRNVPVTIFQHWFM